MLLNEDEIANRLISLRDWQRNDGRIVRRLTFANFGAALTFVNQIGEAAEAADHHPDILIHDWNRVELSLTTHSETGLTRRDFDLAEKIESLIEQHSDQ